LKHKKARALPSCGWREWVALPDLKIECIKAKVDTGARTSTLHAFDVVCFKKSSRDWVRFNVHPIQYRLDKIISCTAELQDIRYVTNSGGNKEERYVIVTTLAMGEKAWPIELTLTNRDAMRFRMLLGRTALRNHFLIDLRRSYLTEK